jgi:hypothetical protein
MRATVSYSSPKLVERRGVKQKPHRSRQRSVGLGRVRAKLGAVGPAPNITERKKGQKPTKRRERSGDAGATENQAEWQKIDALGCVLWRALLGNQSDLAVSVYIDQ